MNYTTGLLAAYPSTYGTSTLLSDNLVRRPSFNNLYPSAIPYGNDDRLLSDDLAFNPVTRGLPNYRPPLYTLPDSNTVVPNNKYQKTTTVPYIRRPFPSHESHGSSNDITEYSESLATASNTNTASSVARSINDNNNNTFGQPSMFSTIAAHNYNRPIDHDEDIPQYKSTWSSTQKQKKPPKDDNTTKPAYKQYKQQNVKPQPPPAHHKEAVNKKVTEDLTPVPSPPIEEGLRQHGQKNYHQPNRPLDHTEKQPTAIDVQAWVNDSVKASPLDDKAAEQVWSVKIGQLHMVQAQREKEKSKSSRTLPQPPKKTETKPNVSKHKPLNNDDKSHDPHNPDSYFDTLFEGDFFRKPSTNNYSIGSSFKTTKQPKSRLGNSLDNIATNVAFKNPKNPTQKKAPRYEPPSITKKSQPVITTSSWRKQHPQGYLYDTLYPYYGYDEITHQEFLRKDADERFREALNKLRADRAEKQHKEINETTAKRLNYGDYVRHSTKDALLQNVIKPSPWSDFMDLKKGNLYTLSQEEKKQLYKQSKTYGERIRYRNFAINYGAETTRSRRHSAPLSDDSEDTDSGNDTPRQRLNQSDTKSHSRVSKRPGSKTSLKTTNKTSTKSLNLHNNAANRSFPNQTSRTTMHTDPLYSNRPSENGDDDPLSGYETNRKYKPNPNKRNTHYPNIHTNNRTAANQDDNNYGVNNPGQRNPRGKNRENNDDLFTLREEQPLQRYEGARQKKR